jgi:hypothetical protein
MHPARAAAARNIKNVAAGSIINEVLKPLLNKINRMPFTSKESDDYYRSINQSELISSSAVNGRWAEHRSQDLQT